jgi:hypothetical protein
MLSPNFSRPGTESHHPDRPNRSATSREYTLLAPFYGTRCPTARSVPMKKILLSGLTIVSPLAFPLTLKSGQVIETVGDAAAYFGTLTEEKRELRHWQVAVRMLNHALDQPTYLKTATMSLQTALLMEGLLASPLIVGGD